MSAVVWATALVAQQGVQPATAAYQADLRGSQVVSRPDASRSLITIGVIRRDGLLLPFASFNGKGWQTPWPDPERVNPLPIGLSDIPKKWWGATGPEATWTAWLAGGHKRPLKFVKLMAIPVFCSLRFAVLTDYRGEPFERREPTVPKDGLAIAGDASLLPIENVTPDSPDAREILRIITEKFNEEEKVASKRFTKWKHPYSDTQRQLIPIEIEAFYRASENTQRGVWTNSYVEAIRKFPPGPKDRGCGLITFVRGWVHQQAGRPPQIDVGARIAYCDRADVSFMLPFGRFHAGDDIYWVYQQSSWRDELYMVSRATPKEVRPVVAVSGGFCPR
jgi:hypothetical protein